MLDLITQQAQKKLWEKFNNSLTSEVAEEFLQTLLTLMQIVFVVNHDYRKNLKNFQGKYQFCSQDGEVTIAAVFHNNRMDVMEKKIDNPNITITFRDGKTLLNFIIAPRQDILGSMLRHDVVTEGNLNYLYKFGFMAKQLQLMMPQLPR
ncbi:MAG: hypothetical protein KKA54_21265 [Proteobacteria bacterium]|nr:hypothetical protein [Pseudomonadota bacterium]MBU0968895.1 hypothetical protein [Pseudomonadota bacterium]